MDDTITPEQRDQIRRARIAETRNLIDNWGGNHGHWFWLSFVGDGGFLGAVILRAPVPAAAPMIAHDLKINPGGEVAMHEIPDDVAALIPDRWKNRLLSREDAAELDVEMTHLLEQHAPQY